MSRYELRILLSSWGLMVDLDLSVRVADREPQDAISVAPSVWLRTSSAEVWSGDLRQVVAGLRRVAPIFQARLTPGGGELVFTLNHLWYPLTEFQEGAIEIAVAGWAVEKLDISVEPAIVTFDKPANRYIVKFDESLWLSGDTSTTS